MNLGRDRLTRHISEGCLVSMFFFSLLLEKVPQSDFWCWNFILESYYAFLFGKKWCVTLNLKFTVKSMGLGPSEGGVQPGGVMNQGC